MVFLRYQKKNIIDNKQNTLGNQFDDKLLCQKNCRRMYLKKMNGAPEGIRTPDRSVRSRLLYPAELRVRVFEKN